jgi:LmbE family N-acetylglucosaminyl deacetylase
VSTEPVPRALAIAAHPDDVEFQCGATLARWAAEGWGIDHLICTDGSKGTWDPEADLDQLGATRQREQRAAARALGAEGEVAFCGWVDGETEVTRDRIAQVTAEIRRLRPTVVLTHDPWKRYRLHPDHRTIGWIALDAVVAARDPHFFADQPDPHHRPERLMLFEADEPDVAVDVAGFADTKVQALLEHRSQFETTMDITDPDDAGQRARFRDRIIGRLQEVGARHGMVEAEEFKLLDDV